jgi:ABC-type transport system involved in Fe-S cluster assembly fused permease/ATPase subunit
VRSKRHHLQSTVWRSFQKDAIFGTVEEQKKKSSLSSFQYITCKYMKSRGLLKTGCARILSTQIIEQQDHQAERLSSCNTKMEQQDSIAARALGNINIEQ